MSLIDELSDNISDLKDNLKVASKIISKNSKEIKRQAKLKLEIAKEEKRLNDLYKHIGKEYYQVHKRLGDDSKTPMHDYISEIDRTLAKIEALKLNSDISGYSSDFESHGTDWSSGDIRIDDNDKKEDIIYIDQKDLK